MAKARRVLKFLDRPWVSLRILAQALAIVGFFLLFVGAQSGRISGAIANLPLRLNPLTNLAAVLASREFATGSRMVWVVVPTRDNIGRILTQALARKQSFTS